MFSAEVEKPMMATSKVLAIWVATAASVTTLDVFRPAGVEVSAAFIILVLTAIFAPWRHAALALAAAATLLVTGVYILSSPNWDVLMEIPVVNRSITVVLLWITAALVVRHKVIEHELAETRARFKETFEQTAVGIAHVALDGGWIGVNGCFAEILGYASAGDLAATDLLQVTHPDDAVRQAENMRRLRQGEVTTCSGDKRCVRKDGSSVWVHETMSLVKPAGTLQEAYFLCIIQEAGERKRAEQHLMQLKAAVDCANDAVVVVTPVRETAPATIDYVNTAFQRMFGYPAADVIGRDTDFLLEVVGDRRLVQALADGPANVRPIRRELIGRARDGSEVAADWHVTDVPDEARGVRHRIAIARDIAEAQRYERALEASEQRARKQLVELEALFQTAPIGLAMFSRDLRYVRVNERLAQMHGVTAADHVGRTPAEIIPDLAAKVETLLRRVIETRTAILDAECQGRTPRYHGELRIWRQQFYPVLLDDAIDGVGAVVEDITLQRRGEEHLRLVMRELNHRVKNSLAVVQSIASQTVRASHSLADFEEALIGRIRALADTHTLLTESNWRSADLRQILQQSLRPYRAAGDRRVQISGEEIALTPSASLALSMVMHELSTNAVKYGALSSAGGRISVDWRILPTEGTSTLLLRWVETGADDIRPPSRSGFGSQLIEFTVRHEFEGWVQTTYRPDGLTCEITIPWNKISPAGQSATTLS